ncbi:hypothetical protein FM107_19325 [Sphingobacterium sp. JB170]|nr:hypothetical protein FM107_19325 [Sphingobacterium sp. JB170]
MAIFLGANTYICKCNLLIEKLDWNIHLLFNILFLFISFSAAVIKRSQHRSDGSGRATAEGTSAKRLYS